MPCLKSLHRNVNCTSLIGFWLFSVVVTCTPCLGNLGVEVFLYFQPFAPALGARMNGLRLPEAKGKIRSVVKASHM